VSAFRTMDPGKCAACPEAIEEGDLVVMVNDEVVHLECEDPEKAVAAVERMPFDVDDPPRAVSALPVVAEHALARTMFAVDNWGIENAERKWDDGLVVTPVMERYLKLSRRLTEKFDIRPKEAARG